MRKPETIEYLYLDFDGFFASVHQQVYPHLRGKPVGIVPFDGTKHTCVIAVSKEAKARGCSNVMRYGDAQAKCPEIILIPQQPDLYRRAHNTLIAEINSAIPIDAVKSIDEIKQRQLAKGKLFTLEFPVTIPISEYNPHTIHRTTVKPDGLYGIEHTETGTKLYRFFAVEVELTSPAKRKGMKLSSSLKKRLAYDAAIKFGSYKQKLGIPNLNACFVCNAYL